MEHFVFEAEYTEEGTWLAAWCCEDGGIFTEATSWVGLYSKVDDAVRCHLGLYPYTATFAEFSFDIVRV